METNKAKKTLSIEEAIKELNEQDRIETKITELKKKYPNAIVAHMDPETGALIIPKVDFEDWE